MARTANVQNWAIDGSAAELANHLCGDGPNVAPAATVVLLMSADQIVLNVGLSYCQTALMCENNTTQSGTTREYVAVIPPACNHGILAATRVGPVVSDGTIQAPTYVGCDHGSLLGATPNMDPVTLASPKEGAETYLGLPSGKCYFTPDIIDDTWVAGNPPGTRCLKLPEDRVATNVTIRVTNTAGHGLICNRLTGNIETL